VLLHAELAGGFASAACRFLARQVADTQVLWVDHQTPTVDQHLWLARSRFDYRRPLEDRGYPDPAAIHLGFEVGEDLVVFVHLDAVQLHQLSAAARWVFGALSV